MSDLLAVLMDDAVARAITRLQGGRLRFDYGDDYRTTSGVTPLSVSMPALVRSHPDSLISPWLWGAIPGSKRLRSSACTRRGRSNGSWRWRNEPPTRSPTRQVLPASQHLTVLSRLAWSIS
jgi:HipA-like protein